MLHVTRQAVSRWENHETLPSTDLLQAMSDLYQVSINTLLGSTKALFCQCCGMLLTDDILATDEQGHLNEKYCKWCLDQGRFACTDIQGMIDFLSAHVPCPPEYQDQPFQYFADFLMQRDHWKKPEKEKNPEINPSSDGL